MFINSYISNELISDGEYKHRIFFIWGPKPIKQATLSSEGCFTPTFQNFKYSQKPGRNITKGNGKIQNKTKPKNRPRDELDRTEPM